MARRRFTIDVESTSTVDLKKAGAAAYWAHPDTKIICVCYRVDRERIATWRPGDPIPYFAAELGYGWRIVAHNWLFEYCCWLHQLGPVYGWALPPMSAWDCTMARALYWGLPAGLGDVCEALALPVQKDTTARSLMLRMSRPRTAAPELTWWHETDPEKVEALIAYCVQDVAAECALDDALPLLPPREREIFLIDGEINMRGIRIDLPVVDALEALTKSEGARLNADMARATGQRAKTTNQVAVISEILGELGAPVPSLAKADVSAALKRLEGYEGFSPGDAICASLATTILLTRQEAAKASTAKLSAMRHGASRDGRCRGLFQYGGAGRTLRWAGRRVQPQNYPRGTVKLLRSIFALVEQGITADELRMLLPASVMDTVSSMLRGCFIASPGKMLVSGDLSQIEARKVAWLAGQQNILDVFARGEDVYTFTAARIGSSNRQLGKVCVLGLGFGMAAAKFVETALTYGIVLTLDEAETIVFNWREANHKIVSFWWDVDRAFKQVAAGPHGTTLQVGKFITIRKTRKAVRVVLPSGRELTYQNVEINPDEFGRDAISYMGVHPKTKKWERIRTYGGRLVENFTQASARDVMAEAMIELRDEELIGTVHDELLGEAPEARAPAALEKMLTAMRKTPAWAPGLPVSAEGWFGRRYKK